MPKQCLLRCSSWICCQPALAAPCQVWFPLQSALLALRGQLLPTSGPVIYWAALCCLWLPSGCLSGLRFTQSTASLWIIIWPRPACVAHIHTLFVTNWIRPDAGINSGMNSFPQRAMRLAERSVENVMLVHTTHFSPIHPDPKFAVIHFLVCFYGSKSGCQNWLPVLSCQSAATVIVLFSGHLLAHWRQTCSFTFKTYYKDEPFHHKCWWLLMWGLYTGACHIKSSSTCGVSFSITFMKSNDIRLTKETAKQTLQFGLI